MTLSNHKMPRLTLPTVCMFRNMRSPATKFLPWGRIAMAQSSTSVLMAVVLVTTIGSNLDCRADDATTYRLVNVNSGFVLDVAGGSMDRGALIIQRKYSGAASQHWIVSKSGKNVVIVNQNSRKALEVPGASTTIGKQLQQSDRHGKDNQLWTLDRVKESYQIRSRASGRVIDVDDASTKDGAAVVQSSPRDGASQLWNLVEFNADDALAASKKEPDRAPPKVVDRPAPKLADRAPANVGPTKKDSKDPDEVSFKGREKATLLRTNGASYVGQLLELNSMQVRMQPAGRPLTLELKPSEVKVVQTANDTYTYDETTKRFQSARQILAAEARKSGPVKISNDTDHDARLVVLSFRDQVGREISTKEVTGFAVIEIKPKSTADVLVDGKQLVTSSFGYSMQLLHKRIERTETNKTPGMAFTVNIKSGDVPPSLPVRIGEWAVEQHITRRNQKTYISENIGGGLVVTKEYNDTVEDVARFATATAKIENPSDQPMEVTVTLEFDFGTNGYGKIYTREFSATRTIDPRKSANVSVTADGKFSFLWVSNNATVEKVRVRDISCRPK